MCSTFCSLLRALPSLCCAQAMRVSAPGYEGSAMTLDYVLGAAAVLFIFVYLVYALVRPERF
jgi:K+-transporting ATPase KdpF subunit